VKRRLLAVAVALVMAAVGAAVLFSYVAGADRRAMAGMVTQAVLVVKTRVPAGTSADQLPPLVEEKKLPKVAVAPGAVSTSGQLDGLVATTDLQPGEQVLAARFADPTTLANTREVAVPAGLQEVALLLDPQRVLGGTLQNGSTVGVLLSVDKQTHLSLHRVLVTHVQGGVAPAPASGDSAPSPAPSTAPQASVMVTLAVTAPQAERIVFAAENGTVWLSRENPASSATGSTVVNEKNLYR
jgi:pilus assembly protein CpaB